MGHAPGGPKDPWRRACPILCNRPMDNSVEPKGLAQVTSRLSARFPHLSSTEVERTVSELFAEYGSSRVRDFVPIFVEREAAQRLMLHQESVPA